MSPLVLEWLNLLVRVAHVLAAIMWIGDSFLFMWMDSHLSKPSKPREGDVVGEMWMTHSGGFYEVVKLKSLQALPPTLYWFKWESYTTWITGFFLITVVYYLGGSAMLVDANSTLSHPAAVGMSLGLLLGGVVVYHLLCLTPLITNMRVFGLVGLALIMGTTWAVGQVFTARAVFLQVGAMLGSIMSSNVLLRIIPAQREMLAATREGRPVDTSFGARAKQRSTHNHFLTLPVLFTMISNHLPSVYGHPRAWLVLGLVFVFAVGAKLFMNIRGNMHPVQIAGTVAALVSVVVMTVPAGGSAVGGDLAGGPRVSFATVKSIMDARCVTCHAEKPVNAAFPAPPMGVKLETPADIRAHADRIMVRAVHTKTMPMANMTGMTDAERMQVGAWIAQGADVNAPGPSAVEPAPAPAPPPPSPTTTPATPADEAKAIFSTRCAVCHGAAGAGDGVGAVALNPRPRNFADAAWQEATTDDALRKVILEGGGAVGKSAAMPPNADLAGKPEVLTEMVKMIRGFKR